MISTDKFKNYYEENFRYLFKDLQGVKKICYRFCKHNLRNFSLTITYSILCVFTILVIVYFRIINDPFWLTSILLSLLLSYYLFMGASLYFIMKFGFEVGTLFDAFRSMGYIQRNLHQELLYNNDKKIKKIQGQITNFNRGFWLILTKHFQIYKNILRPYRIILRDCFDQYHKIQTLTTVNVGRKSRKTKIIFDDFIEFNEKLKKNIIIPCMEKKIHIYDAYLFFKKNNKSYEKKYQQEYVEMCKFFEEYRKESFSRMLHKREVRNNLIIAIISGLITTGLTTVLAHILKIGLT